MINVSAEFNSTNLLSILPYLEEFDQQIIKLYYGIEQEPQSLFAIADKLNSTYTIVYEHYKILKSQIKEMLASGIYKPLKITTKTKYPYRSELIKQLLPYVEDELDKQILINHYHLEVNSNLPIDENTYYHRLNILHSKIAQILKLPNYQAFSSYDRPISKEKVLSLLPFFNTHNQEILSLYYGLNREPLSQTQIAKVYNVSRERINRLFKTLNTHLESLLNALNTFLKKTTIALSTIQLNILKAFYIENKPLSIIAQNLDISSSQLIYILHATLNALTPYFILKNPALKYQKNYPESFTLNEETKPLISYIITSFNPYQIALLKDYYGIEKPRLNIYSLERKYHKPLKEIKEDLTYLLSKIETILLSLSLKDLLKNKKIANLSSKEAFLLNLYYLKNKDLKYISEFLGIGEGETQYLILTTFHKYREIIQNNILTLKLSKGA